MDQIVVEEMSSSVREKIKDRLDEIESLMKQQKHLENPLLIYDKLPDVEKFWSIMSEDDKEFIAAVRFAIEIKIKWD